MPIKAWKILPPEPGEGPVRLQPLKLAAASLDAAAGQLPEGAYTSFRTYRHSGVLRLDEHFDRLEETCRLAGKALALDRDRLRAALRAALAAVPPEQESRLRVVVDLSSGQAGGLYLAAEPLRLLPSAAYQSGVQVWARPFMRQNPAAKLTGSIAAASELRRLMPENVNEILIVNDQDEILEGLSSNFFAVQDGLLITAGQGMLAGITRQLVLEEAAGAGLAVLLKPVRLAGLGELQEAFITSASRGVLPVRQVDEQPVFQDTPGPITRLLMERFERRLASEIQPI